MAGDSSSAESCDSRTELIENAFEEAFVRYRRGEYDPQVDAQLKEKGKKILQKYGPKNAKQNRINTHSVFWLVTSIAVFYYTDFYVAVRVDPKVDWLWLIPGVALLLVTLLIAMFCIIWCHYIKKQPDYDKHYPIAVPLATVSFIFGMICSCVGLWPVWGWFTPLILLSFFMGIVFATTIIPL